jgi:hypothetical protein
VCPERAHHWQSSLMDRRSNPFQGVHPYEMPTLGSISEPQVQFGLVLVGELSVEDGLAVHIGCVNGYVKDTVIDVVDCSHLRAMISSLRSQILSSHLSILPHCQDWVLRG